MTRIETLLRYDPESGYLFWLVNRPNGVKSGHRAGSVRKDGYRYVCAENVRYYAQVLIWFIQTGNWPDALVDHENRNRDDNRWSNLRQATRSQNGYNSKLRTDNTTGVRGVYRQGNGFRAQINVKGERLRLGMFSTIGAAANARQAAEIEYCGEFR